MTPVDLVMAATVMAALAVDAALWCLGLPTFSRRLHAHGTRWPIVKLAYVALAAFLYWHFWG